MESNLVPMTSIMGTSSMNCHLDPDWHNQS